MRSFLFILSVFSTFMLQAQVPGFMGKRFAIFLEGNPVPAVLVQNMNNAVVVNPGGDDARTDKVNRFAFNVRPQATIEYLLGRNFSVGVSYSKLMVGTERALEKKSNNSNAEYETTTDVVKGQAAGLHLKVYGFRDSASPAPIGFYQTFSAYVTQTNTYDNEKSTTKLFKNEFIYPVVTMSVGRQSMIAKNLLLKVGVETGIAIVPSTFVDGYRDGWSVNQYASYNVNQSLFGYYLFNFNIALGYIPF